MNLRSFAPITFLSAVVLAAASGLGACSAPPRANTYVQLTEDLKPSFTTGDVAPALGWSCGSLDCHGTVARNMRIYSQYGLRLAPNDTSASSLSTPITQHEIDADFRSVSALEPEIMDQVVAEGGADPERLTFIRKARGTEHHKGGTIMVQGDALDTCLTSWLAGKVDQASCDAAAQPP
jgi:hypothetical protein